MVEHKFTTQDHKFKGSNAETTGTSQENCALLNKVLSVSSSNTVIEQSARDRKFKGSNPAATG